MTEGIAADKLRSFIDRIERLEAEKAELAGDVKEVYLEAKATGFDTKIMRKCIQLRKMDDADRREHEELLDLYTRALEGHSGTVQNSTHRPTGVVGNGSKEEPAHDAVTGEIHEPPKPAAAPADDLSAGLDWAKSRGTVAA